MIDEQEGLVREELEAQRAELLPDRIQMKRRKGVRRRGKLVCRPADPRMVMLSPVGCPPGMVGAFQPR